MIAAENCGCNAAAGSRNLIGIRKDGQSMQPYTVIMFAFTVATAVPALLLFRGQTGWLNSFSRAKVKDREAYARFLGKSVAAIGTVTFLSGIISLTADNILFAVFALLAGMIAVFVRIVQGAKKYY